MLPSRQIKENAIQFLWTGMWCIPLFAVVYGYTNWRAKFALKTYSFAFDWELSMPFIPAMILPYMSLNLMVMTPVLFTNPGEIRRLGRATAMATVMSGAVFYLMPAPISFVRPSDVPGWNFWFDIVWGLDGVNNTLPSMHVAMAMLSLLILWRFLSTPWKMVYLLWFALVVASVLFTWQHHIADIVGGIIVGAISYAAIKVHGDPNVFSKEI